MREKVAYPEANGAHDGHCENIKPCAFEPLSKCRPARVGQNVGFMVSYGLMTVAKVAEQASSLGWLLVLGDGFNGSGLAGSRLFPPTSEEDHCGYSTELERQ